MVPSGRCAPRGEGITKAAGLPNPFPARPDDPDERLAITQNGGSKLRAIAAFATGCVLAPLAVAATPTPARVQVSADELNLALSRSSIRSGPAIVELVNYGEDDHDLALRRVGGTRTYRIGIVRPGKTGELETRFRAGRFVLWCTLAGHRADGMRATLRVTN